MHSFPRSTSLQDIESALTSVEGDAFSRIRVPTDLSYGGLFGIAGTFIQFLAHWARTKPNGVLQSYAQDEGAKAFQKLSQEPHGLCAIYFSPSLVAIDGRRVEQRDALEFAIPRIAAMQKLDLRNTMSGRGALLCCFQGAENEFLRPFYKKAGPDGIRDRDDFGLLAYELVHSCDQYAAKRLEKRRLQQLGSLLFELFKNTNDHAYLDESNRKYKKNVRGLLAKHISIDSLDDIQESSTVDGSLNMYLAKSLTNQNTHNQKRKLSFIELTIFDAGPGLVKRWLSKDVEGKKIEDIDIEEEIRIVRECFSLHATTKDENGSGVGLDNVLKSLRDLHAFLRLRTGRLHLIQDFSGGRSQEFSPQHSNRQRPQLPLITGTTFSIIIPLNWNS